MLRINSQFHHHHHDHANRRLNFDCSPSSSSSSAVRPPSAGTQASPSTQTQAKRNPKLLSFLLQAFIMTLVLSLFFVFVGIAVIVFLHLCLVGGALHRRHRRYRTRPHDDQSGLSVDEIRTLPKFKFRAKSGQRSSELCAICLDNCVDGIWCRELPDCKHVFHASCVDRWLAKSRGCPVCRTNVRLTTRSEEESTGIEHCGGQLWYAFG